MTRLSAFVRRVPGGAFTEALFSGALDERTFEIEAPHGTFWLRDGDAPIVLVGGGSGLYLGQPITALDSVLSPTSGGSITINGSTIEGALQYYGINTVSTAPIRAWGPVVLYGQSAPVSFANWARNKPV